MTLLITRYDRKRNELSDWTVAKDDCHSPEKDWGVDNRPELVGVIGKIKLFHVYTPKSQLFSQTDYTYLHTVSLP